MRTTARARNLVVVIAVADDFAGGFELSEQRLDHVVGDNLIVAEEATVARGLRAFIIVERPARRGSCHLAAVLQRARCVVECSDSEHLLVGWLRLRRLSSGLRSAARHRVFATEASSLRRPSL